MAFFMALCVAGVDCRKVGASTAVGHGRKPPTSPGPARQRNQALSEAAIFSAEMP